MAMRKICKITVLIILILAVQDAYCQLPSNISLPEDIVPESPNAASLGIFGAIPVGHYTGIPNISIPIYEIDLDGKKIPIAISYHASGIRVAQEASWVGLGWALNAGGIITRQVQDDIDFVSELKYPNRQGYFFSKNIPYYLSLRDNYSAIDPKRFADFVDDTSRSDTEPDLYTYNFGNYSGVMMTGQDPLLGTSVSSTKAKAILRDGKEFLSIEYNFSEDGSWIAHDGDGYTYYFRTEELSKPYSTSNRGVGRLLEGFIPSKPLDRPTRLPAGFSGPIEGITSSWMLDSIKSPKNNVISFHYEFDNIETTVSAVELFLKPIAKIWDGEECNKTYLPGKSYNYSYSQIKQARLTSIKFNGGEIHFVTADRLDLCATKIGDKTPQKLNEIVVQDNNNNTVRSIKFSHSYFGNTSSFYTCRLKLDKLEINDQIYLFKYDEGSLPPKHSLKTDHWGYFNNSADPEDTQNSLCICPNAFLNYTSPPVFLEGRNRASNKVYMQYGILKSITYPTGTQTSLEYEPHKFTQEASSENGVTITRDFGPVAALTYRIESLEDLFDEDNPNNEGRNEEFLYSQDFSYDAIDPIKLIVKMYSNLEREDYSISPDINMSIWLEKKTENNTYEKVRTYNKGAIPVSVVYDENKGLLLSQENTLDRTLTAGTYRIVLKKEVSIPYRPAVDLADTEIELRTGYYREEKDPNNEENYIGGGLRIKQMTSLIDGKKETTSYSYDGALLMTRPLYTRLINDPIYQYAEVSSQSFTPFSYSAQGYPVGYSFVSEIHGIKESDNGYTKYNFYH